MQQRIAVIDDLPVVTAGIIHTFGATLDGVCIDITDSVPERAEGHDLAIVADTTRSGWPDPPSAPPLVPLIVVSSPERALELALESPLGVLSIHEPLDELLVGVRSALAGTPHLPNYLGRLLATRFLSAGEETTLTARELEVMRRAATGETAQQIAAMLMMSTSTARTHLRHVYKKLGVANRAAAVSRLSSTGALP